MGLFGALTVIIGASVGLVVYPQLHSTWVTLLATCFGYLTPNPYPLTWLNPST